MLRWFWSMLKGEICGKYVRFELSSGYCIGRSCRRYKNHTQGHDLTFYDFELEAILKP